MIVTTSRLRPQIVIWRPRRLREGEMGRRQALVAAGRLAGEVRCVIEEARRGPQTVLDDLLTFPFPSLAAAAAAVTVAAVAAAAAAAGGLGDEGITNPSPIPKMYPRGSESNGAPQPAKRLEMSPKQGRRHKNSQQDKQPSKISSPFPRRRARVTVIRGGQLMSTSRTIAHTEPAAFHLLMT